MNILFLCGSQKKRASDIEIISVSVYVDDDKLIQFWHEISDLLAISCLECCAMLLIARDFNYFRSVNVPSFDLELPSHRPNLLGRLLFLNFFE